MTLTDSQVVFQLTPLSSVVQEAMCSTKSQHNSSHVYRQLYKILQKAISESEHQSLIRTSSVRADFNNQRRVAKFDLWGF